MASFEIQSLNSIEFAKWISPLAARHHRLPFCNQTFQTFRIDKDKTNQISQQESCYKTGNQICSKSIFIENGVRNEIDNFKLFTKTKVLLQNWMQVANQVATFRPSIGKVL